MSVIYSPKIITDGLTLMLDAGNVKSYPGSGTTWYDLTGNGNHGTINNGEFVANDYGGYLRNSGNVSNFFSIDIPNSTSIYNTFRPINGTWTIEEIIWVNSCNYPEADGPTVVSDGGYGYGGVGFDWQHGESVGNFKFEQVGGSSADIVSVSIPAPYNVFNIWKQRTMIWNKNDSTVILYINGTYIGYNNTPNTASQSIYDGGGGISLGSCYGWKHYGRRASFKIWNRALSSIEITQNFNSVKNRFNLL